MTKIELELRERFIKDNNLPLSLSIDPYFDYQLDLYEETYNSRTLWEKLLKEIEEFFEGSIGKYLNYYYETRDTIIKEIENSDSYKEFISDDDFFQKFDLSEKIKLKTDLYTCNNLGKYFLQIDLKKANFSALKYYDSDSRLKDVDYHYYKNKLDQLDLEINLVEGELKRIKKSFSYNLKKFINFLLGKSYSVKEETDYIKLLVKKDKILEKLNHKTPYSILKGAETYEDFIGKWSNSESFKRSKYTRQVIFGKLNPKRQIHIEEYLINRIIGIVKEKYNLEIFSSVTDEVIFLLPGLPEISGCKEMITNIKNDIEKDLCLEVKTSVFYLNNMRFISEEMDNKTIVSAFVKSYIYPEQSETLHCVPSTYYSQVYKHWKGLEIEENKDLIFLFDNKLAKFISPLKLGE